MTCFCVCGEEFDTVQEFYDHAEICEKSGWFEGSKDREVPKRE